MDSLISAKQIYISLGIEEEFDKWIKDVIMKLDLVLNFDYSIDTKDKVDKYKLSARAVKHVSMITCTPKGKEIREYFMSCEMPPSVNDGQITLPLAS